MNDCIFCKIVKGEIPTDFEKETEKLVVFKDINPKALIHLLIAPKVHTQDITFAEDNLWEEMGKMAIKLAKEKQLKGFRLVHNAGEAAAVPHMHLHFLGEIGADRNV